MPAHDWTRVDAGIFHDFHRSWVVEFSRVLNEGVLPASLYSLIEPQRGGAFARLKYGEEARPIEANDVGGINAEGDPPSLPIRRVINGSGVYALLRRSIVIRRVSDDRVVARIEVATPGNKVSARAVGTFVDGMADATETTEHLVIVIVDLFPPRRHDPGGLCNAAFEAMGGEPFPLPVDRQLCVAAFRVEIPGLVHFYAEPLGVGALTLPDVPLFFDSDHYVNVPMESTYQAAWQATPQRWRDVIQSPG